MPRLGLAVNTVIMYSNKPNQEPQDLHDLDHRQARFLRWAATLIPKLIKAVARGAIEWCWILGRRRLKDGRNLELLLVARSGRNRCRGGYMRGGGASVSEEGATTRSPLEVRVDQSHG